MDLTPKQIEWINREREVLIRLIESKETSNIYNGLGEDRIRLQTIQIIIDLHNLEVRKNDK